MPRCVNGHETGLAPVCETCGGDLDYRTSCMELVETPKLKLGFEDVGILSVGFPSPHIPGAYTADFMVGETDGESVNAFRAKGIAGGTWAEFLEKYAKGFTRWVSLVGFHKSDHRLLMLDAANPLAIVALKAIPDVKNTVALLVVSSARATPLRQNNSYVAAEIARQRGIPTVLATDSYVRDLAFFVEDLGPSTGERAFEHIVSFFVSVWGSLVDVIGKDARLGIGQYYFSALMSASDKVYRRVDDAFRILREQSSLDVTPADVATTHLIAAAPQTMRSEIERTFEQYLESGGGNLLNAESRYLIRTSRLGLYDLVLLYGMGEDDALAHLRKGYATIADTVAELSLETLA